MCSISAVDRGFAVMRCIIHDWYDVIHIKLCFCRVLMRSCCAAAESTTTQLLTTRPTVADDVTTSEFVTVATIDSLVTTAAANSTVFFVNEQYGFRLGLAGKPLNRKCWSETLQTGWLPFPTYRQGRPAILLNLAVAIIQFWTI